MSQIPVICDRCRATGTAGEGDFAHLGDLLEFAPVPRKTRRADGWTPERQRAFIAALSATGSPRQAARAVGMAAFGADRLRVADGSDSFRAAWDRALAIAAQAGTMRISTGLADVAARQAHADTPPSRLRGHDPEPDPVDPEESMDEDSKLEILDRLIAKFMAKVGQERSARIGGRVAEADFYLRQVTCLEVSFDLMAEGAGMDAWHEIARFRRGGHGILQIADTAMSRMLDDARRAQWAAMGEPARPEHPPERYLTDHGTHRTEGTEHTVGGDVSYEDQKRAQAERHARDAEEQVRWEAQARREYEERRDRDASS